MEDARAYLQIGMVGEATELVEPDRLASRMGSGVIDVYATPAMVALMEKAAVAAVEGALPAGWITVGTRLDVRHLAATPSGHRICARACLEEIAGLRLVFSVSAHDEQEVIGRGSHGRHCVELADFMGRAARKAAAAGEEPG